MPTVTAWPGKPFPDRLVAVRGDTTSIGVALKQSAGGSAWDLSALSLAWSARDAAGDVVLSGVGGSGITVVSAEGGTATIAIAASDWDALDACGQDVLSWDLEVNAAGAVSTVAYGTITVRQDVTR